MPNQEVYKKLYRKDQIQKIRTYGSVSALLSLFILPLFYLKDRYLTCFPTSTLIYRLIPWLLDILFLGTLRIKKGKLRDVFVQGMYIVLMLSHMFMLVFIFVSNYHLNNQYIHQLITSFITISLAVTLFSFAAKRYLIFILGLPYLLLLVSLGMFSSMSRFEVSLFFNPTSIILVLVCFGLFQSSYELKSFTAHLKLKRHEVKLKNEILKSRKLQQKIEQSSMMDELTGIFNRKAAVTLLEKEMHYSRREQIPFMFAYADLNNLKVINDTMGHKRGDDYICAFSQTITTVIREGDYAFRMGGDEFLIYLKNITLNEFDQFKLRLSEMCCKNNISFAMGAVSHDPLYRKELSEYIEEADQKMYAHKKMMKTIDIKS